MEELRFQQSRLDVGRSRVLVVEDNSVERQLISKVLRDEEFDVLAIHCGEAVLAAIHDFRPNIVLLDSILPDTDGFEVCRHIRLQPKLENLPVIMLTALDDLSFITKAYHVGATDFFSKPVKPFVLAQRIRYLLRYTDAVRTLRMSQRSLDRVQSLAKLGSWELDAEKNRLVFSPRLREMLELEVSYADLSVVGTLDSPLIKRAYPADRPSLLESMRLFREEGKESRMEARFVMNDGSIRYMDMHLGVSGDDNPDEAHMLGVILDITDIKHSEQENVRLLYFDGLTHLPNKQLLEIYCTQMIPPCHKGGKCVALILLDVDLFSRINHSMGHVEGDKVLQQLADRILTLVSPVDNQTLLSEVVMTETPLVSDLMPIVSRLGADSFAIALPNVEQGGKKALLLARQIKASFETPFESQSHELFITASMGIAYSTDSEITSHTLLQHADFALHEAKFQGRDRVSEYNDGQVIEASHYLAIQNELKRAIKQNELELFYQPKMAASQKRVTGFEALVRWFHPEKGMIPPDQFIAIAEESGQIVEMGLWILEMACRQNKQWIDDGLTNARMAVNVSARQFKEKDFAEEVQRILNQTDLPANKLELEITEGLLMSNTAEDESAVVKLRKLGVTVAMDDFGTGYSSLSYLSRFPIDVVKIDRRFIQNIHATKDKSAIVGAICTLGHNLGFTTVAEGVETEEELQTIRLLGCDHIQGYLCCKPMSAKDITQWLISQQTVEDLTDSVN